MNGLIHEEMQALEALSAAPLLPAPRTSAAVQTYRTLVHRGLAAYDSDAATIHITSAGERALFHVQCQDTLRALAHCDPGTARASVYKWLVKSGFVSADFAGGAAQAGHDRITERGKIWLASFDHDPTVTSTTLTAEDFARRRRN